MTLVRFLLQNSQEEVQFFEGNILLTITSIEVILGISFLALSNIDVMFEKQSKNLIWRSYTITEGLFNTCKCQSMKEIDSIMVILKESKSWEKKKKEKKLHTSHKIYVTPANIKTLVKQIYNLAPNLYTSNWNYWNIRSFTKIMILPPH